LLAQTNPLAVGSRHPYNHTHEIFSQAKGGGDFPPALSKFFNNQLK
jgi:hypothetical protein